MAISDPLAVIAPEYDAEVDRDVALELASTLLSPSYYGTRHGLAVAYLAAHLLATRPSSSGAPAAGGSGAPTSIRTGDLAVSFGGPASTLPSDAELSESRFGRALIRLRAGRPRRIGGIATP